MLHTWCCASRTDVAPCVALLTIASQRTAQRKIASATSVTVLAGSACAFSSTMATVFAAPRAPPVDAPASARGASAAACSKSAPRGIDHNYFAIALSSSFLVELLATRTVSSKRRHTAMLRMLSKQWTLDAVLVRMATQLKEFFLHVLHLAHHAQGRHNTHPQ